MKKTTINISYDEEKLVKMLDTLYGKTVPASVREFISMKSESYTVTSKMNKSEKTT